MARKQPARRTPRSRARRTRRSTRREPESSGTVPKIRVRMYRQGLGDCFLVTLDPGGAERHLLIDCGTLGATTTGVKAAQVIENVRQTTGNRLDVLVATHEHWDHLSGFTGAQQAKLLDMTIDQVWMAWTENPGDALAQEVRKYTGDLGAALLQASRALSASASESSRALGEAVAGILGFFDDEALAAGEFKTSVNAAMEFLRAGTPARTRYWNPGDRMFDEPWAEGFRFYVLGPPRSKAALNDLGEHGSDELYSMAPGLRAGARLRLSARPASVYAEEIDAADRTEYLGCLPFDPRFRRDMESDEVRRIFGSTYLADEAAWRRVDEDWLHAAGDLALQLDGATNNTSLVLAIERVADGKVLLFAADAQQGSWVSWHDDDLRWTVPEGSGVRTVTSADLLSRTVFYKVGHHGSHNATANPKGLELMTATRELVAFIPVDRAVALGRNPKGTWQMPARALYRRLLAKCEGRVVRSDLGWAEDAAGAADPETEKELLALASAEEWAAWKEAQDAANVTIGPLFIDYELE